MEIEGFTTDNSDEYINKLYQSIPQESDKLLSYLKDNNLIMPSLHLLRSSYDGLVYDIPCDLGAS